MTEDNLKTFICAIDLETNEILYVDERCMNKIANSAEKMPCPFCPLGQYIKTRSLRMGTAFKLKNKK
jgi:hypothetical protein